MAWVKMSSGDLWVTSGYGIPCSSNLSLLILKSIKYKNKYLQGLKNNCVLIAALRTLSSSDIKALGVSSELLSNVWLNKGTLPSKSKDMLFCAVICILV